MNRIIELLFEAKMLRQINRSGYAFLGNGRESVAEHTFMTAFICFVMARMEPDVDEGRMIGMALLHDLPEARTGDFNYVQKKYADIRENDAITDLINGISFGNNIQALLDEFNQRETKEAMLVNDADQLSFILELKHLKDVGARGPEKWLPVVVNRLKTPAGKKIAAGILKSNWDDWWLNGYAE